MLTDAVLQRILERLPDLTIGVLGDLFLDRYLDIDARLNEPSLETGLDAYQVVRVRSSPGAAGTVINNLAALGVQRIIAVTVIGDDGEGFEVRRALSALGVVDGAGIQQSGRGDFRTPTYTKPMYCEAGSVRELNRLDIKNRLPLSQELEEAVLLALQNCFEEAYAWVVLDQVTELNCGVVTERVQDRLRQLGETHPQKFILADSRSRIGSFRGVSAKPNRSECMAAAAQRGTDTGALVIAARSLAQQLLRPVFCTCGEQGILLVQPHEVEPVFVPAYAAPGPIDSVGAGDSTSAGIVCAIAAGANGQEAAAFGNLVASITIQKIGTTGTASADEIRSQWQRAPLCRSLFR